jgi:hypothetical protein
VVLECKVFNNIFEVDAEEGDVDGVGETLQDVPLPCVVVFDLFPQLSHILGVLLVLLVYLLHNLLRTHLQDLH